jgi:NAD(P)-dependent dehydrogenase (short-subunit alcohol dehydrogenase family)
MGTNVVPLARYIATDMNVDTRTNSDSTYLDSITTRIPMGAWGKPEDFKGPAIFLASNASSYVSGETIVVRGTHATHTMWKHPERSLLTRLTVAGWHDEGSLQKCL